jgi:hypothetical protein
VLLAVVCEQCPGKKETYFVLYFTWASLYDGTIDCVRYTRNISELTFKIGKKNYEARPINMAKF